PGKPGVGPSGADMQHVDMIPARTGRKALQCVAAKSESIPERHRHRRSFIGEAAVLQGDLLQARVQRVVDFVPQCRVVSLEEDAADILQALSDLRVRAGKPAPGKFNFGGVDVQKSLKHGHGSCGGSGSHGWTRLYWSAPERLEAEDVNLH